MVKASEASGKMPEMLEVLAAISTPRRDRKQIKAAMIYPFIMLLMATAATGSLISLCCLGFPRFTKPARFTPQVDAGAGQFQRDAG